MRRLIAASLLALIFLLPVTVRAQPAPQQTPLDQAFGQEVMSCTGDRIQLKAALIAAQQQIAELTAKQKTQDAADAAKTPAPTKTP